MEMFNEYLKRIRLESGLTVREFVKTLNTSVGLVYKYESQNSFSPLEAANACMTYKIPIQSLRNYKFNTDMSIDEFISKAEEYAYIRFCKKHRNEIENLRLSYGGNNE